MRFLICTDAPFATSGYSVQGKLAARALRDLGHAVAFLCTYGLHGADLEWDGFKLYQGGADPFANDRVQLAAKDWQADIVITLKDTFVFRPEAFQGLRWCPMVPVDHEPAPPAVGQILRHAYRPIAYAPNGVRELRKLGFDPLYAPHCYDPAVYFPVEKTEARRVMSIDPAAFVVGVVAVNRGGWPSRKAWPQLIEGFARALPEMPGALLYTHTWLGADGFEQAVNLPHEIAKWGIGPAVLPCEQERYKAGFPLAYMNAMYGALDVLLAVSLGEGFGVPTLEAQACARPVIVGAWAAQEDLCFGGWALQRSDALNFPDGQGASVYIPQPEAIAAALTHAYKTLREPGGAEKYGHMAWEGAQALTLERVRDEYWTGVVAALEAQMAEEGRRGVMRVIWPEEVLRCA